MGPRAGLDGCGKSRPTGILSQTVQPVASRYNNVDVAVHESENYPKNLFVIPKCF